MRPRLRWFVLALLAATTMAYGDSLSGPFVRDDIPAIVENTSIRSLTDPRSVFSPERELPEAGRPLVNLSFALNYAAGGLNVGGYHAVNVAVHKLCGLLVFGLARRSLQAISARRPAGAGTTLSQGAWFGFATALVWLVHPLDTETVNYITQRSELMMALCYLLTMYASVRAIDSPRPVIWAGLAVMSCAAGMACKESMATAPVMVALLDVFVVFGSLREAVRNRWRLYAALAVTEFVLLGMIWSGPRVHSAGFSTGVSPWTYLLNQAPMIAHYLRLTVWPHALVGEYGWPRALGLADVWPQGALVIGLLILTVAALVRRPVVGFLGAWFFVTLAPTSSIVPIATEVGAERRMYLPLIACVALAAAAAWYVLLRVSRTSAGTAPRTSALAGALLIIVSASLGWRTWARNRDYQSSLVLAQIAVDRFPNGVARLQLAQALLESGRRSEGMDQLRLSAQDNPRAHYALGVELFNEDRLDEAIAEMNAFIRDQPYLVEVISAHQALGRTYARQQRWPEAVEQYRLSLKLDPSAPEAADTAAYLADALYEQESFSEAIVWYRKHLQSRPSNTAALTRLGLALVATGQADDALNVFRHIVEMAPEDAVAQRNLATALYDHHDLDEAIRHAQKAIALRPADAAAHQLLGRALAIQGDFAQSVAELEHAVRLDPQNAEIREDLRRVVQVRRPPAR